ncbi:hypothetical protein KBC75_04545 [Candidatus Shapirobacteria bacterium]|nr:hypothetical protein [Candidatus Shapirobacteria bacterium]
MPHPFTNPQISEYLTNIATCLIIRKENRFRIVSYQNASDTILAYPEIIYDLWLLDPKKLDEIPHVGPAIFDKIDHLFKTGKPHPHVLEYQEGIHPAVFTLTKINGVGPLIAHKLTQSLIFPNDPLKALEALAKHCQDNKLSTIPGLGEKSQASVLTNTLAYLGRGKRLPYSTANDIAKKIISYLTDKYPSLTAIALGSLRRACPTVGDIDIAVKSTKTKEILKYFANYPESVTTINTGKNKTSIRLPDDIRVDLMVKPTRSWGSLLQHFTGSRQHNILLRRHALKLGFSLSEYGIKDTNTGLMHYFSSEEKFYNFLGFHLIPPEERAGEKELEKYRMV